VRRKGLRTSEIGTLAKVAPFLHTGDQNKMRASAEEGIRRKPGDWGEQVGFSFDLVINALIAGICSAGSTPP
jgi:hypothetical protein